MFQLTAARRRLGQRLCDASPAARFQLTAARRRLARYSFTSLAKACFNSQPPEGGWDKRGVRERRERWFQLTAARRRLARRLPPPPPPKGFNSQPPEGGWDKLPVWLQLSFCFNSQPPEGGWVHTAEREREREAVSTHSRPKAAGRRRSYPLKTPRCFNSQPPEGGWFFRTGDVAALAGFNSQPPEGGWVSPRVI